MSARSIAWEEVTLEDLTRSTRPIQYGVLKPGPNVPSGIPLVRVCDISTNTLDDANLYRISASLDEEFRRTTLRGGELLISVQGTIGKVAVVPPHLAGANISRTLAVIEVDRRAHSEYVRWFLLFKESQSDFVTVGATRDSLNIGDLRRVRIPLPSLPEQRRIGAILTEQMAAVDRAKAAVHAQLEAARALPAAFLRAVFPQDGEPMPEGWRWARLGDVCAIQSGGTPSKAKDEYWTGAIPWASPKDMKAEQIADASDHISEEAVAVSAVRLAPPLSILAVVRSGILAHTFPLALTTAPMAYNQDIKALLPRKGWVESAFLLRVLQARAGYVVKRGVKTGATVHSVRSGFLEELALPLPPLPEQHRIAAELTDRMAKAERLISAINDEAAALARLPSATLSHAFAGGL